MLLLLIILIILLRLSGIFFKSFFCFNLKNLSIRNFQDFLLPSFHFNIFCKTVSGVCVLSVLNELFFLKKFLFLFSIFIRKKSGLSSNRSALFFFYFIKSALNEHIFVYTFCLFISISAIVHYFMCFFSFFYIKVG